MAMELHAILLHHLRNFVDALTVATQLVKARSELVGYRHQDTRRNVQHMFDLREEVW
jgi:hypothetical protein